MVGFSRFFWCGCDKDSGETRESFALLCVLCGRLYQLFKVGVCSKATFIVQNYVLKEKEQSWNATVDKILKQVENGTSFFQIFYPTRNRKSLGSKPVNLNNFSILSQDWNNPKSGTFLEIPLKTIFQLLLSIYFKFSLPFFPYCDKLQFMTFPSILHHVTLSTCGKAAKQVKLGYIFYISQQNNENRNFHKAWHTIFRLAPLLNNVWQFYEFARTCPAFCVTKFTVKGFSGILYLPLSTWGKHEKTKLTPK